MVSVSHIIIVALIATVSAHRRPKPTSTPISTPIVSCEFANTEGQACTDAVPSLGTFYKFARIDLPFNTPPSVLNLQLTTSMVEPYFAYYYINETISRTKKRETLTAKFTSTMAEGSVIIAVKLPATFGEGSSLSSESDRVDYIKRSLKKVMKKDGTFKKCSRKGGRGNKNILACQMGSASDLETSFDFRSRQNFKIGLVGFPALTDGDFAQFDPISIDKFSVDRNTK